MSLVLCSLSCPVCIPRVSPGWFHGRSQPWPAHGLRGHLWGVRSANPQVSLCSPASLPVAGTVAPAITERAWDVQTCAPVLGAWMSQTSLPRSPAALWFPSSPGCLHWGFHGKAVGTKGKPKENSPKHGVCFSYLLPPSAF